MKNTTAYLVEDLTEELATLQTSVTMVENTATQAVKELTTLQAAHDALQKQFAQVSNQLTVELQFSSELKAMVDYLEQRLKGEEVVN